ncbi:hypothetical protein SteCoe_27004 [Stentor coeruleus]|uniref:Anoctamin transmembrane domain-containing protein n=1 Tax=Stentor coeruleus TaxID=5963 RepID=A0A1R2BBJ7_9CILI|nr:hypothetical protein SteCoe_27004 [Stentor coeruleus]
MDESYDSSPENKSFSQLDSGTARSGTTSKLPPIRPIKSPGKNPSSLLKDIEEARPLDPEEAKVAISSPKSPQKNQSIKHQTVPNSLEPVSEEIPKKCDPIPKVDLQKENCPASEEIKTKKKDVEAPPFDLNSDDKRQTVSNTIAEKEEIKQNCITGEVSAEMSLGRARLKDLFLGIFPEQVGKSRVPLSETIWDYALVFINPDFGSDDQKKITAVDAEQYYKNCFKARKQVSPQQQTLGFMNEISAFVDAYYALEDFEDGKKFKNGGSFEKAPNEEYIKKNGPAKDFLTLIYNAILVKLVEDLNLKVKQLISSNGQYIFYIISADDEDLAKEAERTRYRKELELGLCDLISLIPCDNALRPFHMLKSPANIKEIFKKIKPFFSKALELTKNTEKIKYKYDPVGVTPEHWEMYLQYLIILSDEIPKIEEKITHHKHKMLLFKTLLKDALLRVNIGKRKNEKLRDLWSRMNIDSPFAPFAEYRRPDDSNKDELSTLWKNYQIDESGKRSLFKNAERIRLICSYIYNQVSLNALEENDIIIAHYPFHNNWMLTGHSNRLIENIAPDEEVLKIMLLDIKKKTTNSLIDSWSTSFFNQKIPSGKVRNYFGEKIALYFEFLRYFQCNLFFPGIVGLIVFIIQKAFDIAHPSVLTVNAFYCIFISIWGTVFLEVWKRKESSFAIIWGQTEFEKIEIPRPQFKGELRRSPITDDMEEIYYSEKRRYKYFFLAGSVTILIILMVLAIVASLIILKARDDMIYNEINFAGPVCSIVNAIQIQLFNVIYTKLVKILTNLENHRTQNQYEDSLILKTFAFQFVNSFNSLVYIAFIKCKVSGDDSEVCLDELYTQLISIVLVSYAKNLIELGLPYGKYLYNKWRKRKVTSTEHELEISDLRLDLESQLLLDTYVSMETDGTIEDYLELAIQFGYLTLFSLAFPLSTSLLFIGLYLEMLTDKLKILKLSRRPIPLAIKDIGTWYSIFSMISALSIISNTALFCFTAPTFRNWQGAADNSYLIFVVVVAALFIFRGQLMNWIPDVEERFNVLLCRHEFIVEKYLRGSPAKIHEDLEMYDTHLYYGKGEGIDDNNS